MIARRSHPVRRRGITLLEMMISAIISSIFLYVVSVAWMSFDRAAADVIARASLAREADIALAHLADDLRGMSSAQPRPLMISPVQNNLHLAFADKTVEYTVLSNGQLVRAETPSSQPAQTVAWSVQGLTANQVVNNGTLWEFRLTMGNAYVENRSQGQTLTRTYTLVTVVQP
jgi:type II secretory pathway component PulJ